MRTVLRGTGTVLAFLVAALVLPASFGAATSLATFDDLNAARIDGVTAAPKPATYDPDKRTAVVVVGARGAVVSDALAPYEVLATTGAFNVYTVGPATHPVPLTGGLDLVADLTFDQLDRLLGGAAPDVIVVPAMPDLGDSTIKPVTDWLSQQAARGSLVLGVCTGAGVLAEAGLLDGRDATTHWYRLDEFQGRYPGVTWQRGTRYVEDGTVVTTAGILSGIDGTLRVIERLSGPATAVRTAGAIGWRHYSAGTAASMEQARFGPADAAITGVNTGFRWDRLTVGVLLTAGVGELELASAFDTYGQSLAVRTLAVGADGAPVRSRHGLTFVPRSTPDQAAGDLDRLVVPGAKAATEPVADRYPQFAPVYPHRDPGFPYDGVLADLAGVTDTATARWTAKMLEYPIDHLTLTGPDWPWTPSLRPVGLAILGVLAALGLVRLVRRVRAARTGHRVQPG